MENNGYFKDKYRIDSARLPFWDYSRNGDYFIAICAEDGILRLKNKKVSLVETQDFASWRRKRGTETQDFASLQGGSNKFGPQSKNLASIIRGFKIGVTKFAKNNGIDFAWQERFYDHIIQDEEALYNIRQYIKNNPINWESDRNYKKLAD